MADYNEIVLEYTVSETGAVTPDKTDKYPVISNSIGRYKVKLNVEAFPHNGAGGGTVDAIAFRSARGIFVFLHEEDDDENTRSAYVPNQVLAPDGTFQFGFISLDGEIENYIEDGQIIIDKARPVIEYKASSMWSVPIRVQDGAFEGGHYADDRASTVLEKLVVICDKVNEIKEVVDRFDPSEGDQLFGVNDEGELSFFSEFVFDCGNAPK